MKPANPTEPLVPPIKPEVLVKKFPVKNVTVIFAVLFVVVILAGVGTGWLISGRGGVSQDKNAAPGAKVTENEAGINDEKAFPDEAEGVLKEGGIGGEGTHYLDRDLGPTKYVYLASTVIDLQSFVDKKIHVWGATQKGKKAGWLMDVGRVKVVQ